MREAKVIAGLALMLVLTLLAGCAGMLATNRTAPTPVPPAATELPPEPPALPDQETELPPALEERLADAPVPYSGPVEHIFFHPLIAYPERAFDGDWQSAGFDDWFVTVPEFQRILVALYRHDYMLVDIRDLYEERVENGTTVLVRARLALPRGKKPLVISIDDMNYYDYMRANGTIDRLILDTDGRIAAESTEPGGQKAIRYDNAIVPILDSFVAAHPDFALRGAKGVIALTGYEGILGYRTNRVDAPGYAEEKAQALAVVQRLKETGWSFASHSWGHRDHAKVSEADMLWDIRRWQQDVEPLVGPTPIYIFPFGSRVTPVSPKFRALRDAGFRLFAGVGPRPVLQVTPEYVLMDRRHVDGLAFRHQRNSLLPLFDADEVIQREVRPKRL